MLGFLIGTACLMGLIRVLRGGGYCRGYAHLHSGGCGGARWGGWGGGYGPVPFEGGPERGRGGPFRTHGRSGPFRSGYGMSRAVLRRLFEVLDTTPGQEKVIAAAMDEMREVMGKHRGELRKSREDLARAMRSEGFDEVAMGELFARHDAALEEGRKAAVGALARVHEALDERQRERLAELFEQGPFAFGNGW